MQLGIQCHNIAIASLPFRPRLDSVVHNAIIKTAHHTLFTTSAEPATNIMKNPKHLIFALTELTSTVKEAVDV